MAEPRDLYILLHTRVGYEVKQETVNKNQIRIIGSVPKHQMGNWLILIKRLLEQQEGGAWKIDISKQYFKRAEKLVFGWRLILQAEGIADHLPAIMAVVQNAPRAKPILDEYPLPGASAHRNMGARGKGASTIAGDGGIPTILTRR